MTEEGTEEEEEADREVARETRSVSMRLPGRGLLEGLCRAHCRLLGVIRIPPIANG